MLFRLRQTACRSGPVLRRVVAGDERIEAVGTTNKIVTSPAKAVITIGRTRDPDAARRMASVQSSRSWRRMFPAKSMRWGYQEQLGPLAANSPTADAVVYGCMAIGGYRCISVRGRHTPPQASGRGMLRMQYGPRNRCRTSNLRTLTMPALPVYIFSVLLAVPTSVSGLQVRQSLLENGVMVSLAMN